MATFETVRRLKVEARGDGIESLVAQLERVERAQRGVSVASTEAAATSDRSARGVIDAVQAFERYERATDPAARATQQFVRDLRTLQAAQDQGVISAQRYRSEMERLSTTLQNAGTARAPTVDQSHFNRLLGIRDFASGSARASADVFTEFDDMARAADRLRAELNPVSAAYDKLNGELVQYQALASAGIISTQELAAAQGLARQRFDMAAAGLNTVSRAGQMTTGQLVGMQYQLNDVAVSLASGQSPFLVLMQQGMQVSQMFGPGSTLRSAVSAIGTGFVSMLNPINLAVVGIAAAAGAASLVWDSLASDVDAADEAVKRHEDLIRSLKEAYAGLNLEAKGLAEISLGMTALQARAGRQTTSMLLRQEGEDFFGSVGTMAQRPLHYGTRAFRGPQFVVEEEFRAFEVPLQRLRVELAAGRPNVDAFSESVAKIANDDLSHSLDEAASSLLDLTPRLRQLAADFAFLGKAADEASPASLARRHADAVVQYSRLRAMGPGLAERERLEATTPLPTPSPLKDLGFNPYPEVTALLHESRQAIREQTAALELQVQTFGKSAGEVAELTEMQRLLNEAERANIAISPDLIRQFGSIADEVGRVAQAYEELTEKQRAVVDGMDDIRSTSSSSISDFINDLRDGKSAAEALANVKDRLLDKVVDMSTDNLTSALFGERGKPGGGLLGDPLGGLLGDLFGLPQAEKSAISLTAGLGGAMTIGSATITAGSVTVMGYGAAGGGIAFPGSDVFPPPAISNGTAGVPGDPMLPPADPARFPGAFDQFVLSPKNMSSGGGQAWLPATHPNGVGTRLPPADPSRFDDAFGQFGPAAPPVYPGTPLFDAAAQAGQSAQAATQSFQSLSGALGATTPQVGQLGQALSGMLNGGGGGGGFLDFLFAGGGAVADPLITAGLYHSGGVAGSPLAHRSIRASMIGGARRFHGGGLAGDEIPAVLRRGEGVFTREQMSAMGGERVQIIDQRRRGSPNIEQKRTKGPDGKDILKLYIREEIVKANAPGGLTDKSLSSRGIRRPYVPR